jgi:DNA-binding IclR family transcriptional regulator
MEIILEVKKMAGKSTTRSINRALDILECFLKEEELSLMEISNKTDLSPSTAHRLVNSLMDKHYLERDESNKKFFLGPMIARLGNVSLKSIDTNFKEIAKKYMQELKDEFNENVALYVSEGDYKLCIERIEADRTLKQIIHVGDRLKINKGSIGKIFLAHMDEEKLKELKERYPNIDLEEIKEVREQGYSFSDGEREEGLVGIACPIYNIKGEILAAISLSGPSIRFLDDKLNNKIEKTKKTAMEISTALGYNGLKS